MNKNIVITGMPGSGKSTVAGILAAKYGNKKFFVDTDETIVKKYGMSINQIFRQYGEDEFRKSEKAVVSELADKNSLIISTGGGCLCDDRNIKTIQKNGIIFYLKTSVEELIKRLGAGTQRPLLNVENPKQKISELESKRKKYYEKADYTVVTDGKNPEEVAGEIKRIYDGFTNG